MKLLSTTFRNKRRIPSKYTCDGQNINPPLKISDVPAGTKSLALIMDDPDAPTGTWVHWTIWNIPPDTMEIPEDSVPANAVEGMTSSGLTGYKGPCPPSGTHRYMFKLYALDIKLNLSEDAGREMLEKAMSGHVVEKDELIGLYKKENSES